MALDPNREVYPNAPLRFVAFELRYPESPNLATQELRRRLYESLRDQFPISQSAPGPVQVQIVPGVQPVVERAGDQLQMVDRARTRAVTVGSRALLVQTSAYTRYEVFGQWVDRALRTLADTREVAAVERIGLRYTDEIRIPGVELPADWAPYVSPALMGPVDLVPGAEARTTQALVELAPSERQRVVMRYGAGRGWIVNPDGFLRTRVRDDGPYFLIDLDSFWTPSEDELPEFLADEAMNICDDLHAPIRAAFESAISERLRNDVLRRGTDEH